MTKFRAAPILVFVVGFSLILGIYPFAFSQDFASRLREFLWGFSSLIPAASSTDFILNIGFFIPVGALLYCSLKAPTRSRSFTILIASAAGAGLSFIIELCQVFFPHHPTASDVYANGLGTYVGALIASFCPAGVSRVCSGFLYKFQMSKTVLFGVFLYATVPLILAAIESPWPTFRTWNSEFTFQIGNEATLDRPWLGTIYLVAIYNRALSESEVAENFRSGISAAAPKQRSLSGLVSLYTFSEGHGDTVRDLSGVGRPLNLSISPSSHVRWQDLSNGIEIFQPAILRSEGPARKLVDAFRGRTELSIESWATPANLTQNGPARLVSFSGDLKRHNFTLGQQGADIMFWVRALISGRGGSPETLRTSDGFLTLQPFHIVATYARGVERLYVNGTQQSFTLDLTRDVIIGFGVGKTLVAQIAYTFFYFFPVTFFLRIFLSRDGGGFIRIFLMPVAIGTTIPVVTEIFEAFAFGRRVDYWLFVYATIVSIAACLIGALQTPTSNAKQTDLVPLKTGFTGSEGERV